MTRAEYYNYIEERLMTLSYRIEKRGKLNILDYHLHSENFYRDFLNLLFGWELVNLNETNHNVEGIDLIDHSNKIFIQVSAVNTKVKIEASLEKQLLKEYENYTFKFISIARSAENLKNKKYDVPSNLSFDPKDDIYDADTLFKKIINLKIDDLEKIYAFIKKELGSTNNLPKLKSDLSNVINILAKENLNKIDTNFNLISFDIERKIEFNKLNSSRLLIEDFKIHHNTIDNVYSEYDKMGQNKSLAVLYIFRKEYINHSDKFKDDELYKIITENIVELTKNSNDLGDLSEEELKLCVDILMVDAFIRCKIFENPNNYSYASTR